MDWQQFLKYNIITITKTLTCGWLDEIQVEGAKLHGDCSLPFLSKNIYYQAYGMNWLPHMPWIVSGCPNWIIFLPKVFSADTNSQFIP